MRKNSELFRRIYSNKMIKRIDKKIKLMGNNYKIDVITFINIRVLSSLILFFIILYLSRIGYIVGPVVTIIYYYLFEYVLLDSKINERRIKLEREAIHFFEVLTLSLDTGKNLEEAIVVTIANVTGELATEFENAMKEVSFGKSMVEALKDMEKYIPSENINNIVLSLCQSSLYGSSVINNLYDQIDFIREKRKMEIKSAISKIPIKISVISVLFFVPLILIIILGPVLLDFIGR